MNTDYTILLVGAGNMGGALLGGWLDNGIAPERVSVLDPAPPPIMLKRIEASNVRHLSNASDCTAHDIVLVACKPQVMDKVLATLGSAVGEGTLVISVAAGKTLSTMQSHLGPVACIRSMPNTPALVGKGVSVLCANALASDAQMQNAVELLSAVGSTHVVDDESLMDAVTAVSGSGPAYVFLLAEVMAKAGRDAGLPEELATKLARETVIGGGQLMAGSDEPADQLRTNVTSPGGTTQAALEVLMGPNGMIDLMRDAVAAAAKRSRELS